MAGDREHYKAQYDSFVANLDQELSKMSFFNQIEAQTKIPKTHVSIFLAFIVFVCVVFNFAGPLVTNLIGFVYPGRCTAQRSSWSCRLIRVLTNYSQPFLQPGLPSRRSKVLKRTMIPSGYLLVRLQ